MIGEKRASKYTKIKSKNTKHAINEEGNERVCSLKTYLKRNLNFPAWIYSTWEGYTVLTIQDKLYK